MVIGKGMVNCGGEWCGDTGVVIDSQPLELLVVADPHDNDFWKTGGRVVENEMLALFPEFLWN